MKIRQWMIVIAALAIPLGIGIGLHNRSKRFSRLAYEYSGNASGLEDELVGPSSHADSQAVLDRVHWNDEVANAYRRVASRPWMSEPDPAKVICRCGHHAKLAAAQAGR